MEYLISEGAHNQDRQIEDDPERSSLLKRLIHPEAYDWLVKLNCDLDLTSDEIYWFFED